MISLNEMLNTIYEIECRFHFFLKSKIKKEQEYSKITSNVSETRDSATRPASASLKNEQKFELSAYTAKQRTLVSTHGHSSKNIGKNQNQSDVSISEEKKIAHNHPLLIDLPLLWKKYNTLKQTWMALLNKRTFTVQAISELYEQSADLASSTQFIENKLSALSAAQQYKYSKRRSLIQALLTFSMKLKDSTYSALKLKLTTHLYEMSDDFFPYSEGMKNIFYTQMPWVIQLKTKGILESSLKSSLQSLHQDTRFKHPTIADLLAKDFDDEINTHAGTLMSYFKNAYEIYQICGTTNTTVVHTFMQYNNPFVLLAGWQCVGVTLQRGAELLQNPPQAPASPSTLSQRTYQLLDVFSKNHGFVESDLSSDSAKKMVFEWRSLHFFMGEDIFNLNTSKYQFASELILQNTHRAALINSVSGHDVGKKILQLFSSITTHVSVIAAYLHAPLIKSKNIDHAFMIAQINLAGKKYVYRITDVHGGEFETDAENLPQFLEKLFISFKYNSKNYKTTSLFILDSSLKALIGKEDKKTQEMLMMFSKTFETPSKDKSTFVISSGDKPKRIAAPMKEARRNTTEYAKQTAEHRFRAEQKKIKKN